MKKIVFNGIPFCSDELYGIARHTYEVLRELDKIVEPDTIEILSPKCNFDPIEFKNIKFKKIGLYKNKSALIQRINIVFWKYIIFRFYCVFNKAISVNTTIAFKLYNFDVMSIYDCTPEIFYSNCNDDNKHKWTKIINNQLKNTKKCKIILTDSESARADIAKYYNFDINRIKVVYCGWQHFTRFSEDDSVFDRFNISKGDYFFTLGSRMPHKNIKWISYAAKKHQNYKFVITGSKHNYVDMSFEGDKLENIIFTGYLKDEEIKALAKYCKAFILPSFYEGFGIPPLEAMSVGADCIVSNTSCLPEIYQNSVWYIDPNDYNSIDLDEIMSRPKESNDLVLNRFSWKNSASVLWDILKDLASNG